MINASPTKLSPTSSQKDFFGGPQSTKNRDTSTIDQEYSDSFLKRNRSNDTLAGDLDRQFSRIFNIKQMKSLEPQGSRP